MLAVRPSRTSTWYSHVTGTYLYHVVQSRDGHLYYDVVDDIPYNTELLVAHALAYIRTF